MQNNKVNNLHDEDSGAIQSCDGQWHMLKQQQTQSRCLNHLQQPSILAFSAYVAGDRACV